MNGSSGHYADTTQRSNENNEEIIVSDGADVKMNTEVDANTDSNALAIQTLQSQNGLLVVNAPANVPEEEVFLSQSRLDSLPVFSGNDIPYDASKWLTVLNGAAMLYHWSEATKLTATLAKLKGPAYQWQIGRNFESWFDFEEQFKMTYVEKMNVLMGRIQGKDEELLNYFQDKMNMCAALELNMDDTKKHLLDGMGVHLNHLIEFLWSRSHDDESDLLSDIMDYMFAFKQQIDDEQIECKMICTPGIGGSQDSTQNASNQENYIDVDSSLVTNSQQSDRPRQNQLTKERENKRRQQQEQIFDDKLLEETMMRAAYNVRLGIQFSDHSMVFNALIDSGSPVSLIKVLHVEKRDRQPFSNNMNISGINGSRLNIKCVLSVDVFLCDYNVRKKHFFYVVSNDTMAVECLLGRDFINGWVISFGMNGKVMLKEQQEYSSSDVFLRELPMIEYDQEKEIELNIGEVSFQDKFELRTIYRECYLEAENPEFPKLNYEVTINLTDRTPFKYQPQTLSYSEKNALKDIIFDLLIKGIIKESRSEFCSPIELVKKKDNSYHMCLDLTELNNKVMKEHIPLIDIGDILNNLSGKKYFTKLVLKNTFFHIKVAHQSSKYLSFKTFLGTYEYIKMPFKYCNSFSEFLKFINLVFKELIMHGKLLVHLNDLLIATETKEENLEIIKSVLIICNKNLLELREDKCIFLKSKITYLGYLIDSEGVRPDSSSVKKVTRFPIPKTTDTNELVNLHIPKKNSTTSNSVFLICKKFFLRRK